MIKRILKKAWNELKKFIREKLWEKQHHE